MTVDELDQVELHMCEDGTTVLLMAPGGDDWLVSPRRWHGPELDIDAAADAFRRALGLEPCG